MALGRRLLATQKAGFIEQFRCDQLFNPSCRKQCQKVFLVNRPASLVFFEIVQNLLGWGKIKTMEIIDSTNRPEEITEVIPFGKAGQLGNVLSRISMTRLMPAWIKRVKNPSVVFLVKPMVNTLMSLMLFPVLPPAYKRSFPPVGRRPTGFALLRLKKDPRDQFSKNS